MSLSGLFKKIGAPLRNVRWSWGAVRPADNAVFLRVWQDAERKIGDQWYAQLLWGSADATFERLGHEERKEHIERVRNGARCYLVMCVAENVDERPRKIKSYNGREVFLAGDLLFVDGLCLVARKDRIPIREVI